MKKVINRYLITLIKSFWKLLAFSSRNVTREWIKEIYEAFYLCFIARSNNNILSSVILLTRKTKKKLWIFFVFKHDPKNGINNDFTSMNHMNG